MIPQFKLWPLWQVALAGGIAGALVTSIPAGIAAYRVGYANGAGDLNDQLERENERLVAEKSALLEQQARDRNAAQSARQEREFLRGRVSDLETRLSEAKDRAANPQTIIRTVERDNEAFANTDPLFIPTSDGLREQTRNRRQDYR